MTLFEPQAPTIPPLPNHASRPQWSVMIPTYEPGSSLEEAIGSVLAQNIDAQHMQIAVVDDGSPTVDVRSLVKQYGGSRVEYYGNQSNLGPINNWNHCLELAKGDWIHLLHQDDFIQPQFYEKLGKGLDFSKDVGAAFCRHLYVDENSETTDVSILESNIPGVLHRWQERIAEIQRVQFVSIVVRRSVYEVLGGFSPTAASATDWEMWQRISGFYPIWYEPTPLASFRLHKQSETSQLLRQGRNITDSNLAIAACAHYLVPSIRMALAEAASRNYGLSAMETAENFLKSGDVEAALGQICAGLSCSRDPMVIEQLFQVLQNWEKPTFISNFPQTSTSKHQDCETNDLHSPPRDRLGVDSSLIKAFKHFINTGEIHTFRAIRVKALQIWMDTENNNLQSLWESFLGDIFQYLIDFNSPEINPNEIENHWLNYIQEQILSVKKECDFFSLVTPLLLYKDAKFIRDLISDKSPSEFPDYFSDAIYRISSESLGTQSNQDTNSNYYLLNEGSTFIF